MAVHQENIRKKIDYNKWYLPMASTVLYFFKKYVVYLVLTDVKYVL